MFVSGNELYGVIAALLLATPTVIWLGLRMYAVRDRNQYFKNISQMITV